MTGFYTYKGIISDAEFSEEEKREIDEAEIQRMMRCIKAFLILLLIPCSLFYCYRMFLISESCKVFTPSRIERMEEIFGVSLEDAEPVEYTHYRFRHTEELDLTVRDWKKLMDSFSGSGEYKGAEVKENEGASFSGSTAGGEHFEAIFWPSEQNDGTYTGVLRVRHR